MIYGIIVENAPKVWYVKADNEREVALLLLRRFPDAESWKTCAYPDLNEQRIPKSRWLLEIDRVADAMEGN
jgi:hypothetical protein